MSEAPLGAPLGAALGAQEAGEAGQQDGASARLADSGQRLEGLPPYERRIREAMALQQAKQLKRVRSCCCYCCWGWWTVPASACFASAPPAALPLLLRVLLLPLLLLCHYFCVCCCRLCRRHCRCLLSDSPGITAYHQWW